MKHRVNPIVLDVLAALCGLAGSAHAEFSQETPPAAAQDAPAPATADKPALKQEELEQLLAPIALYPDDLVSQLLMASTYPLEIVMADRWVKAHKDLKGDAAAKALEQEPWDASVKSLVNFPDLLAMMSDKLDWTQKLGDTFLGQQTEVMDTIQKLRAKAKESGNLETNENQKVEVQQQGSTQVITIQSANPQVVYVPVYDPVVVYGAWPYPAYPPYPYYPPAYGVGVGIAVGFAWGYAWGGCDWDDDDINIDINRNTEINHNIDRGKYQDKLGQRGDGTWKHDPAHRQSVPYRDQAATKQYGGRTSEQAAQARESYRGRTETSNLDRSAPGSSQARPQTASLGSTSRTGALGDVSRGGQSARTSSSRGWSSRSGGRAGGGGRRR